VTGQFALLVFLFRHYELESPAAGRVMVLALVGFVIQWALPLAYRKWLFLALTLTGVVTVLSAAGAAWVIGIGLLLMGLCHLPVRFGIRVALVLATGAGLALMRGGLIAAPFPRAAWFVLGSFFMFRMIVYLYDLRHHPEVRASDVLCYFFLLPNVCFPLFPVVDFRTFTDSYHSRPALEIYQQGVHWMVRGAVHLVLFRVVYYYFVLGPEEVTNLGELVQFLLSNILLYLRVSGQFHLIIGMLKMFGWDLPETNHLYFLASSFNEYWRRINIYWKNFMTKVFYLPAYMALAGRGVSQTAAVAIATVGVFVISWQLHSYQWFWLQGVYPLRSVDAVFWGMVGLLVLANTLREVNRRQRRFIADRRWSMREIAVKAASTLGTFSVICVLWSLWTSNSIAEWTRLMRSAAVWGTPGWLPLALATSLVVAGGLATWYALAADRFPFSGKATSVLPILLLGLALTQPAVLGALGPRGSKAIAELSVGGLNRRDSRALVQGYYEEIQRVDRIDSPLWQVLDQVSERADRRPDLFEATGDIFRIGIRPLAEGVYRGARFSSNRWGMRDQDYALEKPPGTLRIAILGSSHSLGHGVADEEIFEALLEERLNREGLGGARPGFEVLNFSYRHASALQLGLVLEIKALPFDPDLAFHVGHRTDAGVQIEMLAKLAREGIELDPFFNEVMAEMGVDPSMSEDEIVGLLEPREVEFLAWSYARVVQIGRENGVVPFFVYHPTLQKPWGVPEDELLEMAREAGFEVLSLAGVFEGMDRQRLVVGGRDFHPNAVGHRLLAQRLFAEMQQSEALLRLARRAELGS